MSSKLVRITAPDIDVIGIDDIQTLLAIEGDDDRLEMLASAVAQTLDPWFGGWLGRALRPQQWELRMSHFPSGEIEIPYPPLVSIDAVTYVDDDGDTQTVDDSDYRVFGLGGHEKAKIAPVYDGEWPTDVRCDDESVRVKFTAGYEITTVGDQMPQAIRSAIALGVNELRLMGRNLYISSEDVPEVYSVSYTVSENAQNVLRSAIGNLLTPYRVFD